MRVYEVSARDHEVLSVVRGGGEDLMATVTVKTATGPGPAVRSRVQNTDRRVGARMRERRIMLGLTQSQLAELIGVTHQHGHSGEADHQFRSKVIM